MSRARTFILAVGAMIAASSWGYAQTQDPVLPKLSVSKSLYFQNNPEAWSQFLAQLPRRPTGQPQATPPQPVAPTFGGTWTAVTTAPTSGLCNPLLLTNGTVLVHDCGTRNWYILRPDNAGNYATGSWSATGLLPSGYGPQYHASAVLPDGRVIIQGGEYNVACNNAGTEVWTSLGAIYDPGAGTWTAVSPPSGSGWTNTDACGTKNANGGIGDAASIVLPDGVFMLGACCANPSVDALLNATTLTYSATGAPPTYQDEQGYMLLQTGNVLTIDVWDPNATHLYNPGTGAWTAGAATPVSLIDPTTCGNFEIGPAITRPDGTTVAFGGNTGCTASPADPTAIYTASTDSWVQGPNVPAINSSSYTLADAPAALLPNGNILFAASPGFGPSPTHFFEFTSATSSPANSINQVADPVFNASTSAAFYYNFLVLPNGQIFMTDFSATAEVYTPTGSPNPAWAPTISSVPTTLSLGASYQVNGSQLNGLSQGAAYGDDVQGATNYPLVQIANNSTGHVFYAATSNFSTMSIAPGQAGSASFQVASGAETGASTLRVIANGIASQAVAVTIVSGTALTVSVTGSGTVASSPSGISCPSTCSAGFAAGTPVTLTATPASGWIFSGWGGACSGSAGCTVTMNSPQSVSATFVQGVTLSVSVTGSGTVTSSPSGISCPSSCSASYISGTQVTLTATPASGWNFSNWGGACSGSGTCSVTMNSAQSVTATFTQASYTLSVSVSGSGTVTSSPSGISCSPTCSANFLSGTPVTLTATPASGATFNGWTGACSGSGGCSVTMNAAASVSASFTTAPPPPVARTFVSAAGNDSNNCANVATPCRHLAAAYAATAANGEIYVLDPANYGSVTITRPVSIEGHGWASIAPVAGQAAITINANTGDKINIIGVVLDGTALASTTGIRFNSGGSLNIRDSVIRNFTQDGIAFASTSSSPSQLSVSNVLVSDNSANGIDIAPSGSGTVTGVLDHVDMDNNGANGLVASTGAPTINVTVNDSLSANNGAGISASSVSAAPVNIMVRNSTIANNASDGLVATSTGATIRVTQSTIAGNVTGWLNSSGGVVSSYADNNIDGNGGANTEPPGPLSYH